MPLEAINPEPDSKQEPERSATLVVCPICDGKMELVYNRNNQQVIVCSDCHSGLTIPSTAWNIATVKREAKWTPKA